MKVHFPASITGQKDALVVLEVEFTSKARRVTVQGFEGLEPLDLKGELPGGTYEVTDSLPRLHVPMRVTRDGAGKGTLRVTVEDAKGVVAKESSEVAVTLEAPLASSGKRNKAWILVAFVAIVAAIGVFVVAPMFQSPTVPSLLGKPQEEAVRALKVLGYVQMVRTVEVGDDDPMKDGVVIGQDPAAGTDLPRASTVEIRVAHRREGGVAVPDLVGKALGDAEVLTSRAGFALTYVMEEANDDQVDRVLRQRPSAGSRAQAGSSIELVIAKRRAAPERSVPDVTALSAADAERTLADAKFQVVLREEDAGPDSAGKLLRQNPAAGTKLPEGAKVELIVGRDMGAPALLVDMPDTIAMSEADAVRALKDAGFLPHVSYAAGISGKVVSQMPPAGLAPKGGNVELTVGRDATPMPPPVPPVPPVNPPPVKPPPVPPVNPPPVPPVNPPPVPPVNPPPVPPVNPPPVPPVNPPPVPPVNPPPVKPPPVPPAATTLVVPDVLGLDRVKAEGDLRNAGLEFRVSFEDTDDTAPGIVLRTTPKAGERLPSGSTLDVLVSRRAVPKPHTVPAVLGKLEGEALAALTAEAFKTKITYVDSAQVGIVLTQEPPSGALADAGVLVSLTVGRAVFVPPSNPVVPPPVQPPPPPPANPNPPIPPVMPPAPPPSNLPAPKHVLPGGVVPPLPAPPTINPGPPPVVRTAPISPTPPVSRQPTPTPTPVALATVAKSDGSTVVVPDLRGRTAGDAIATLLALGLVPDISADRDPRAVSGQVRTQSPLAGGQLKTASRVALTVGTGYSASMADVPSVVGLATAAAAARLSAAGLRADLVRVRGRPGVYAMSDTVVAQFPSGKSSPETANPVTIWIIGP